MAPKRKKNICKQERKSSGKFDKSCGSLLHEQTSSSSKLLCIKKDSKKIGKERLVWLLNEGLFKYTSKYICTDCLNKAKKSKKNENEGESEFNDKCEASRDEEAKTMSDDMEEMEDKCKNLSNIQETNLLESCVLVGSDLAKLVKLDASSLYKDKSKTKIESLMQYDCTAWLDQRPAELVTLIRHICNIRDRDYAENSLVRLKMVKLIEQMYSLLNKRLVLPVSFRENLFTHKLTHCKQLLRYNGRTAACGGYSHLMQWLSEQASSELQVPTGMIRNLMDNEQVIGKTRLIKADNKVPLSVITTHAHISIDPESDMQEDSQYRVTKWLFNKPSVEQKNRFFNVDSSDQTLFRETRNELIKARLSAVVNEHKQSNESDFVDAIVTKEQCSLREKLCIRCGAPNDAAYRICRVPECDGSLIHEKQDSSDLYKGKDDVKPLKHFADFVETRTNNLTIKVGEPDFLNPNSFETISKILQNMGTRAGIKRYGGNDREWLFLEVDGTIYLIAEQLIANVFHCSSCKVSFYGEDNFKSHRCAILEKSTPDREFDWIILSPGLLHIEMNATKAFVKLNWEIFVSAVARELGFCTAKAQLYIQNCSDHHKAWQLLQIIYIAITDELLVPYVRYSLENGIEPSVNNYWKFNESIKNPNYCYMQQMVFTFLHAIMLFRTGVRNNDPRAMRIGKARLAPLFYARNHPNYQRILCLDHLQETMMPKELKAVSDMSKVLSRTGNVGHYQGGDACLEEINKLGKTWIPGSGVPTNEVWQKTFRNMDKLEELCEKHLKDSGDISKQASWEEVSIDYKEIAKVRALFRRNGYLLNPMTGNAPMSMEGKPLTKDIEDFSINAMKLKENYHKQFFERFEKGDFLRINDQVVNDMICVTAEEREQRDLIQHLSIAAITKKIFLILDQLKEEQSLLLEERFIKTVKKRSKAVYIDFLSELQDLLDSE